MKILGLALVSLTPVIIGLYYAGRGRCRLADLRQLKKALEVLQGEISFAFTALPEAAEHVASRVEEPVSGLFASFAAALSGGGGSAAEAWGQALGRTRLFLEEEDAECLRAFGKTLGYLDRDLQIGAIRTVLGQLADRENFLAEKQRKDGKLYRNLGILGGLLVAVLLW